MSREKLSVIRSHNKSTYDTLGRGPIHPFPARMSPGIAFDVIGEGKRPLRVLDSMMGSGTVIAMARSKGHKAIGLDIDPLAVLMSKVWTTAIDAKEVRTKAMDVLSRSRKIFAMLPTRDAYPKDSNQQTRKFISYWFDGYTRRQLASLSIAISRVRDTTTRDALWCAFSRLIITKQSGASLAMDLSHSRPHKKYRHAPSKPFNKFLVAVERVVQNCIEKGSSNAGPAPSVKIGDARKLSLPDSSINLMLTSPPYLTAIDYMRCSKFSLVWIGYNLSELKESRAKAIGARGDSCQAHDNPEIKKALVKLKLSSRLSGRDMALLWRYIDDMWLAVGEVARVLVPGGKAVYVVGENIVHGTQVQNSVIISTIARLRGLKLEERRVRNLPANRRYLPPPRAKGATGLDSRIRREVILSFVKPSTAFRRGKLRRNELEARGSAK